jgi:hypothetical protein
MKNGEKKGFDVNDVSAYLGEIEKWRDDLRDMATGALQMQGIEESERDNLKRAIDLLRSIDELVKIIGERPYAHAQAHALGQLWGAIGAAFIIGSRGIDNPLTQKILKDKSTKRVAGARSAKPRIKERDQINAVVARHCADRWAENPLRKKTKSGTARDILEVVNADLVKLRIKPLSEEAVRKRIAV